jgi:hypothetical protein
MPLIRGKEAQNYLEVFENIRFMGHVASRHALPWSETFFVDGENGSDTRHPGKTPTKAFATIAKAVAQASRGDVIYIRPQQYTIGTGFSRYTEDVAVELGGVGGSGAHATNADISIIGVTNSLNPEYGVRWTFATAQALLVDAPSLHVENIGFYAEDATYAIYLRNNGATYTRRGTDGTTFYNCVIKGSGLYAASGGDGLVIEKCVFHSKYNGTSGGIGAINISCSANPGTRFRILDCKFYGGNTTEAPATCYITIAPPLTQAIIARNIFGTIPTDGHYINAAGAGNTGQIVDNFFAYSNIVLETSLHIGGMIQAGNWDTAGIVV